MGDVFDRVAAQQQASRGDVFDRVAAKQKAVAFDPEGDSYDYESAIASGGGPGTDQHWGSLDPRTGMLLKGIKHKSIQKTINAERKLGSVIVKRKDGRYYSQPKKLDVFDRVAAQQKRTPTTYDPAEIERMVYESRMINARTDLRRAAEQVEKERPEREAALAKAKETGTVLGGTVAESHLEKATEAYKAVVPPKEIEAQREYEGFWDEFSVALSRGTLDTAASLAGMVERNDAGAIWEEGSFDDIQDRLLELSGTKVLERGAGGGKAGFVANIAGESAPFTLGAIASTATGGPAAGYAFSFSVINDSTYREAKARGESDEDAKMEAFVVASISAALEQVGVEKIMKVSGGKGKAAVQGLVLAAKKKSLAKLVTAGKNVSLGMAEAAITEGVTEALQELTAVAGPLTHGGEIASYEEARDRITEAGLGGLIMGGMLGGAGSVATSTAEAITSTQKTKQDIKDAAPKEVKPQKAVESTEAVAQLTTPEVTEQKAGVEQRTEVDTKEAPAVTETPMATIRKNNPDIVLLEEQIKEAELRKQRGRVTILSKRLKTKVAAAEHKMAVSMLTETVKRINPKKLQPQHAEVAKSLINSFSVTKPQIGATVFSSDLVTVAQDTLLSVAPNSSAAKDAQAVLDQLANKRSKTVGINKLSTEAINQINDMLVSLEIQNVAEVTERQVVRAKELQKDTEDFSASVKPRKEAGRAKRGVRVVVGAHQNLEGTLNTVGGGRWGTFPKWEATENSPISKPFRVLEKGDGERYRHTEKTDEIKHDIMDQHDVMPNDISDWSKKRGEGVALEDANGNPVNFKFTVAEMMHIYGMSRAKSGRDAIKEGGFNGRKGLRRVTLRGFTNEIIDQIGGMLSDKQRSIAEAVGKEIYVDHHQAEMNRVSVDRDGYAIAKEKNYYPQERDMPRHLIGKTVGVKQMLIENSGIIQQRTGAGRPLKLQNFFEVLDKNSNATANYVGKYGSMLDIKAILTEDTFADLKDKGYEREANNIATMIEQYEGQYQPQTELENAARVVLGNFAKSQLLLKPYLAMRQYLSIMMNTAFVDPKYMKAIRPFASKKSDAKIEAEINEFSAMGAERLDDAPMARAIADLEKSSSDLGKRTTGKKKFTLDSLGGMIRKYDKKAIKDTWRLAKAEIAGELGLDLSTSEGSDVITRRFEYLMRNTQPMWGPLYRSIIGGSKSVALRSVTMFMSARESIVRVGLNTATAFANSDRTAADYNRLAKSVSAIMTNTALFTALNMIYFGWMLGYDDDEDKSLVMRYLSQFGKDLASLPFFGKWLAVSAELTAKGIGTGKTEYNPDLPSGPIETVVEKIIMDAMPGYGVAVNKMLNGEDFSGDLIRATDDLAEGLAGGFGIPYIGGKRMAKGALRIIKKATGNEPKKTKKDWRSKPKKSKKSKKSKKDWR